MNRNKDSDSYIKYISVIDLIIKNSDEKNPITINQIQDLIYDKGYDFKIDFRIVKNLQKTIIIIMKIQSLKLIKKEEIITFIMKIQIQT